MAKLSESLRDEIVHFLAESAADANLGDMEVLTDFFICGIKGYSEYSDDDLVEELKCIGEEDLLAQAEAQLAIEEMLDN